MSMAGKLPLAALLALLCATTQAHAESETIVCSNSWDGEAKFFVFGGPSVSASDTLEAPRFDCALCETSGNRGSDSANTNPLVSLGAGLVGTEGRLRGGAEVLTIMAAGRSTVGYTGFLTYGGVDSGRLFVQTGLGIGAYWGARNDPETSRIAGIAHAELGLRLTDGFSVLARGDFLLGRETSNAIGTLGLQWVPGMFNRYLDL